MSYGDPNNPYSQQPYDAPPQYGYQQQPPYGMQQPYGMYPPAGMYGMPGPGMPPPAHWGSGWGRGCST